MLDDEVNLIFKGKNYQNLIKLETSIEQKINSGEAVDVEYWESVLKRLQIQKAVVKLQETMKEYIGEVKIDMEDEKKKLSNLQNRPQVEQKTTKTEEELKLEEEANELKKIDRNQKFEFV